MSLDRTIFSIALATGLVVAAPNLALAQPADDAADEEGGADEGAAEEEEEGEEEGGSDYVEPDEDSDLRTWGSGGADDSPGRFRPQGKTGKLKELEKEEEEDQEELEGPPDLPPPGEIYLDTVIGWGDITIVEQGRTNVTPTASFLIGAGYRIGDTWKVYARFPVSTNESNGPIQPPFADRGIDRDNYKQIATGAVEVGVRPTFTLTRDFWLSGQLALSFPSAQGDMFGAPENRLGLARAIVNQAAAASRGWEDRALFAYQRFGITPGVGVDYDFGDLGPGQLKANAFTKVEIMIRTGGSDPTPAELLAPGESQGAYNDVAINWVTTLGARYEILDGLVTPGLRFWIPVSTAFETVGSIDPGGAGLVFEPYVATHVPFLEDESLGLDAKAGFIAPAAGELASGAAAGGSILGVRLQAGLYF